MNNTHEREIVKVATLYYKEGLTQAQIAKRNGVSRSLVSKMLIEARKKGLIEFFINSEETYSASLEIQLEKQFGLKKAIVVDTKHLSEEEVPKVAAQVAAINLKKQFSDGKKIGLSWGKSIREFVDQFSFESYQDIVFIPLVGGMGADNVEIHSNQLCYEMAKKTRGKAKYLYAPALIQNPELKKDIEENPAIKEVLNEGKSVDLAILGTSSMVRTENNMYKIGYLSNDDFDLLENLGVVGDINSRFFNQAGEEVKAPQNDSVIGLSISDIRKIPDSIVIAYDSFKWDSVWIICQNKIINQLVTTDVIAEKVLAFAQNNKK